MLLAKPVVFIYGSEEVDPFLFERQVERLASFAGATVIDQLIPYMTTHIVCGRQTAELS